MYNQRDEASLEDPSNCNESTLQTSMDPENGLLEEPLRHTTSIYNSLFSFTTQWFSGPKLATVGLQGGHSQWEKRSAPGKNRGPNP